MDADGPAGAESPHPPLSRLGAMFAVGAVAGAVTVVALAVGTDADASARVFSLGALVFGAALLGWSTAVLAGRGLEAAHRHLETGSDWTEAKSRRAMLLLCAFGLGGMVGVSIATAIA
ncbi:hypothetical protein ACFOZ7_03685 [Natribaculum luteum]|uniref:Uncharacterized protein n=1 Tax=Natribaculum luteum TaxID=1586232 RepID=A0ABD5NVI5_9EURY|nr:hypothetical protein [Natribaculum luteum]